MIAVFALVGLVVGAVLYRVADIFPRFTKTPPLPSHFRLLLPLEMLFSAGAWAYFYLHFGLSSELVGGLAAFSFILLIVLIDLKYRLVPDILMYPAISATFLFHVLTQPTILPVLLGGGLAFGIFALTATLKPGQLGGGDVKLAALIGLVFGFPGVLWALLLGAGSGAVFAVGMLLSRHGLNTQIPYAPFLCMGALVALLYNPF